MSITVEQATRMDRRWFRDHPEDRCFIRPLVPGEVPAYIAGKSKHVLLTRYRLDGYIRLPIQLYTEHPDSVPAEVALYETGERWEILPHGAVRPTSSTEREIWEAMLDESGQALVAAGQEWERNNGGVW